MISSTTGLKASFLKPECYTPLTNYCPLTYLLINLASNPVSIFDDPSDGSNYIENII